MINLSTGFKKVLALTAVLVAGLYLFNLASVDISSRSFLALAQGEEEPEVAIDGYAWNPNIGWIQFGEDVFVDKDGDNYNLEGYAWNPGIGWIDLDPSGSYPSDYAGSHGVRLNAEDETIDGWARACAVFVNDCEGALHSNSKRGGWDGWIGFNGIDGEEEGKERHAKVTISNNTAALSGHAWGGEEFMGWISLEGLVINNLDGESLYTLIVNIEGDGSVKVEYDGGTETCEDNSCQYLGLTAGTNVTLTAEGEEFNNWTDDCDGSSNSCTVTMDSNKEVTANFTDDSGDDFTCEAHVEYNDSDQLIAGEYGVDVKRNGSNVSGANLSVEPDRAGSEIFGVDIPEGYSYGVKINAGNYRNDNIIVTASHGGEEVECLDYDEEVSPPSYDLTVNIDGNGSVEVQGRDTTCSIGPCEYSGFEAGTDVNLTAEGEEFNNWTGDCSGDDDSCTIEDMDSNKEVTATFTDDSGGEKPEFDLSTPLPNNGVPFNCRSGQCDGFSRIVRVETDQDLKFDISKDDIPSEISVSDVVNNEITITVDSPISNIRQKRYIFRVLGCLNDECVSKDVTIFYSNPDVGGN
ncbi:MAG: InlB B-repeat-containing protein [Patescibacteria group bacterium]